MTSPSSASPAVIAAPLERTTLLTMRMVAVSLVGLNEAIVTALIWPFLPALVERLGYGNDGLYVGVMASSFFLAQLLTAYLWGSVADAFGRRPPLILGVLGSTISMIGFGLSSSYWEAVFWRMAAGALNGNVGITKIICGEVTSSKTQASAFGLLSFNWGIGSVVGPMIGGFLADLGATNGWTEKDGEAARWVLAHPFAPPCLTGAAVSFSAVVFAYFFLRESEVFVRPQKPWQHLFGRVGSCMTSMALFCACSRMYAPTSRTHQRLPDHEVEMEDAEGTLGRKSGSESDNETNATASTGATATPLPPLQDAEKGRGKGVVGGEEGKEEEEGEEDDVLTPIITPKNEARAGTGGTDADDVREKEEAEKRGVESTGHEMMTTSAAVGGEERSTSNGGSGGSGGSGESVWSTPVIAGLSLYGICAIGAVLLDELFPVLATLPSSRGGYGLTTLQVAFCLTTQGITLLVYQGFVFGRLVRALSPLFAFKVSSVLALPMTLLMPIMAAATVHKDGPIPLYSWVVLQGVMVFKSLVLSTMFSTNFVLISNAAKGKELGRVNGVGQTVAAAVRTVGPGLGGASLAIALLFNTPSPPFVMSGFILFSGAIVAHLYLPAWTNFPPDKDAERRQQEERDEVEVVVPEFLE
jgi:MFS family permease